MAVLNLCRSCGHRVSPIAPQCHQCGSARSTVNSCNVLSGLFVVAGVLLILLVARLLS